MSSPKPVDPNDPSTWPSSKTQRRGWEARHEIPTPHGVEVFTIKADPEKPGDVESAKAHAAKEVEKIRSLRPSPSPERLAEIAASEAAVRAEIDAGMAGRGHQAPAPAPHAANTPSGQRGADTPEKRLSSLFERYLFEEQDAKLKTPRSKTTYRKKFKVFLDWFGDKPIEDVLPTDISRYKG